MKRDTDYRRKLYDMEEKAEEGMPVPEGEVLTRPDFKAWEKMYFENPNLMPEAHLIAVHKDKYVGTNTLWPSEAEAGCVYNGLTGIDKNYRRKGIATALKVKNLEWAKNKKYTKVKTWNDTTNRAMLSINEALGFQKEPAWIGFKKSVNGD